MAIFVSDRGDLYIKCNACEDVKLVQKGETDRLVATEWAKEHDWKIRKYDGKWNHFCPDCYKEILRERRKKYMEHSFG